MKKFNSKNNSEVQDQATLKSNADLLLHAQGQLIFCRKLQRQINECQRKHDKKRKMAEETIVRLNTIEN